MSRIIVDGGHKAENKTEKSPAFTDYLLIGETENKLISSLKIKC